MSKHVYHGIVPPVVTPLNADGTVNFDDLTNLVEYLIASGVHGLFALGSTGQVCYLSEEDRVAIVRHIAKVNAGRVPIIAGAMEVSPQTVIRTANKMIEAGADSIVTTAPMYTINDEAEVADHFRIIKAGISVPLFAYDIPVRVHKKLSPKLLVQLGKEGVIAGVKDSSGDDVSFRRLIAYNEAAGKPLVLFTGHEMVVDAMALIGADGAVPGAANYEAAAYVRLWDAAKAGDYATAVKEQKFINDLFEVVFVPAGRSGDATGVGAFKVVMAARGIISSATMTAPLKGLDAETTAKIEKIARDLGVIS
ncbi:dihydrodipicolinate synthase family protein [Devosia sp. MC521]|uniref:dihydrodipicolinate synthase family protein n=1 Tax=Devosia sp. MC521 TaxID=2759954 RepID=UPI0015FBA6A7|nr:dihydrodipicolinate synthase family protein [Devosia sp. MC521]MBJ6986376.1 dihydrodipicolinate synthase family protein [Devosia sp. MC521]QMW64148.1 dihydrodipicolinate synthase family protein [Devosia sp. MC521]